MIFIGSLYVLHILGPILDRPTDRVALVVKLSLLLIEDVIYHSVMPACVGNGVYDWRVQLCATCSVLSPPVGIAQIQ